MRTKRVSEVVAAVMGAALALAQTKGALDTRFPRQRAYVAAFFLDILANRKKKSAAPSGDTGRDEGGNIPA